jgi:DNA-binding MarR family transcriptional regulator
VNQLVRISEQNSPFGLEPRSRAALIIDHVSRLAEQANANDLDETDSAKLVRRAIAARARRREVFGSDLFADPAWDILLELYAFHREQRRIGVSKVSMVAGIPLTTALRWLDRLQNDGLVEREDDPLDGRRSWVALSDKGFEAMNAYLARIGTSSMLL